MLNRLMVAILGTALLFILGVGGFTRAGEPMVRLEGDHPSEAELPDNLSFSRARPVPVDVTLRLTFNFAIRNKEEFDRLLKDTQDPASPQYHHFLAPTEIHQRFGESKGEFEAVEKWLKSEGFEVTQGSYGTSLDFIKFAGTVAQIERTLDVKLVMLNERGLFANAADPMVPARFQSIIGSIEGLNNIGGPTPSSVRIPRRKGASRSTNKPSAAPHASGVVLNSEYSDLTRPEFANGGHLSFAPDDLYNFYDEGPLLNARINGAGTDCLAVIAMGAIKKADIFQPSTNTFVATSDLINVTGGYGANPSQ